MTCELSPRGFVADMCAALEREAGSAYLLSRDLQLLYVNDGFRRFARENDSPELARAPYSVGSILDVTDEPLRQYYSEGFARVLASGTNWTHQYECSSPTRYRKFDMRVEAMPDQQGFVVINSLVTEWQLPPSPYSLTLEHYVSERGIVVQCANCRRTLRQPGHNAWDWVPALLGSRGLDHAELRVSHGLCRSCDALFYNIGAT